ncbi:MAG: MoxR family ATPase [Candidatus Heimdallarchaeota archaeon]|nr:MoxR family ATPase [Candidatus Heimdallarchaeota archaeon]
MDSIDQVGDILTDTPIVGRKRELEMLLATLMSGEHILLEGAPGTSKSTLLRFITSALKVPFYQIEGSADLTPSKLIGTFNPNLVLEKGFKQEFFEKGPLSEAMENGGILYIDELNRAAPDATNTLIRAMEEQELIIPRFGRVEAKQGFRVVAAMNPFDDTGVTRISRALFDRLCRIKMDYQSLEEEIAIVKDEIDDVPESIITMGARIARATRFDDRLRQGASVRGAIDFAKIAPTLALIRGAYTVESLLDAAQTAFSGKIWLENPNQSEEEIVMQIVETVLSSSGNILKELNMDLDQKKMKRT